MTHLGVQSKKTGHLQLRFVWYSEFFQSNTQDKKMLRQQKKPEFPVKKTAVSKGTKIGDSTLAYPSSNSYNT